jgi:hypothetical protein
MNQPTTNPAKNSEASVDGPGDRPGHPMEVGAPLWLAKPRQQEKFSKHWEGVSVLSRRID